ncbi:MAG: hypothetical protein ACREO8_11645 [Luteimonas sp.]
MRATQQVLTATVARRACGAALPCALLVLSGCQLQSGTTTITNVSVDGRGTNATRTFIANGRGEFDCVKSASGHCYVVLYVDRCADAGVADASDATDGDAASVTQTHRCAPRVVQAFTLDSGARRQLTGLPPHVRQCVRHDAAPQLADCARGAG